MGPQQVAEMRKAFSAFAARKATIVKAPAPLAPAAVEKVTAAQAVVLPYKPVTKVIPRPTPARAALKPARARQVVAAAAR
jgi:hypothetical protein